MGYRPCCCAVLGYGQASIGKPFGAALRRFLCKFFFLAIGSGFKNNFDKFLIFSEKIGFNVDSKRILVYNKYMYGNFAAG